jgi:phosphoserine phosphatase RsbU/P
VLAFRWLKAKILWRLRNRLIVTYVFVGVVPALLLIAMAFVTLYLFAGQFANFIVISEIQLQLHNVEAVNSAIANELALRIERGESPTVELLESLRKTDVIWKHREVCAWHGAKALPVCGDTKGKTPFTQPSFIHGPFSEIVRDHGNLYLRSASILPVRSDKLIVVSSEALDQDLVQEIANNLGEITLYAAGIQLAEPGSDSTAPAVESKAGAPPITVREDQKNVSVEVNDAPRVTFTAGGLPPANGALDHQITFGTPLPVINWETGDRERQSPWYGCKPALRFSIAACSPPSAILPRASS